MTIKDGFKVWRLEKIGDISDIDEWHLDKAMFMLRRMLLKCRMMKRKLISVDYHEKGHVRIVMEDLVTKERFVEPRDPDVEDGGDVTDEETDPLA